MSEQLDAAVPQAMRQEAYAVVAGLSGRWYPRLSEPYPTGGRRAVPPRPVCVHGEPLFVPHRLYVEARYPVTPFATGSAVRAALMTRHHDGFIREAWVPALAAHPARWTALYAAFVVMDYVPALSATLSAHITPEWHRHATELTSENPWLPGLVTRRVVSYWAAYARRAPYLWSMADHAPYRLARRLGWWAPALAPRCTRHSDPYIRRK